MALLRPVLPFQAGAVQCPAILHFAFRPKLSDFQDKNDFLLPIERGSG
jgi:hypothetical protein